MELKVLGKYEIIKYKNILSSKEVGAKLGVRQDQVWKAWSLIKFLEDMKDELNEEEYYKLLLLGRASIELLRLKAKETLMQSSGRYE